VKNNGDWWKVEAKIIKRLQASYGACGSTAVTAVVRARADWAGPPVVHLLMLRPDVGGACKGVVDSAICVGGEVAAAAGLTQHFCDYKRRGLTMERNFFLSLAIRIIMSAKLKVSTKRSRSAQGKIH